MLCDAGDLTGACDAAEALVDAIPTSEGSSISAGVDLDLATARMISGRDDCSDRSLGLFARIADRLDKYDIYSAVPLIRKWNAGLD